MHTDVTKIAKEMLSLRPLENSVINAARSFYEEQNRMRRLLDPMQGVRSILDQHMEQQRNQLLRCQELFSSPAYRTAEELMRKHSEIARIAESLEPSKSIRDMFESSRKAQEQISQLVNPFRSVLDRIKDERELLGPWFSHMESAADHVRRFLDYRPVGANDDQRDSHEEVEAEWNALDKHLNEVQTAIAYLPTRDATDEQVRASGLSRENRILLSLTLFGLLLQILSYLEAYKQNDFSRQQAAEEGLEKERAAIAEFAFRERLISAIEALAERTPDAGLSYVVGSRSTKVKSAISKGDVMGTIHPNQVVLATEHSGRWVKVRYTDHLENRDVEGWVLKHYLIRQADTNARIEAAE